MRVSRLTYNIGSRHNIQQIQLELFSLTFYINPTEYFQYFLRHHSFSSSHIVGEKYFLSDSLKSCSKQIICYSETIIFRNNIQKIENNIFIYFFIYRYYIILSKEKLWNNLQMIYFKASIFLLWQYVTV